MRILHLIDTLHFGGGAERNFASMLPAMTGHEHQVVYLRGGEGYAPQLQRAGIAVERIPFERATDVPALWRRLREHAGRADVVHTQLIYADLLGRLAALGRAPLVTSVQTTPYEPAVMRHYSKLGLAKTGVMWGADVALSRAASRVVAVSDQVRDALVERVRVDRDKIRVVHNCIDVGAVSPPSPAERSQVRAELGLGEEERVVLTVGKVVPAKGQHLLVDAMPSLLTRVPEARLLIVGEGSQREELAARARSLGLGDRVRMLGLRTDVMRLLGASDLFCLASIWEGMPLVVIEAMASRLPCLLSDIRPHREIQAEVARHDPADARAMIVEAPTAAAWADALAGQLLDAGRRERLGRAGRAAAEQAFDVRACSAQLAAVLAEAAAER